MHRPPSPWYLLAWLIVGVAGGLVGLLVYPRAEAARLQALITDAQQCAVVVRDQHLRELTGTGDDVTSPVYQDLKHRLIQLRVADPHLRFVYVMRRIPGTSEVIFLADSEPPESPDISLPGALYPEATASPGLQSILRTGLPATEGPLQDSFGTWTTAYALLRHDEAGEVSEVIGLDVDASRWSQRLWLPTGVAAGGVWLILGLPLAVYQVSSRQFRLTTTVRRLSLALDQSKVAVVIADIAGRIHYVNLGFCRQVGCEREEALGRHWHAVRFTAAPTERIEQMITELRQGRSWQGQWENFRRDGSSYPARGAVSPVREPNGGRTYYVAVFDDITELVRAEAELRAAKEQAEAGSAAKSQFLAMMSHEIRTPLNGVIGMTSLLRDSPLTPEQEESVSVIQSSSHALLGIIDDILSLTKIEAGKIDLQHAPFCLRTLLKNVVRLFQPAASQKGVGLRGEFDVAPPDVLIGDEGRIRQVLMNLVGNAVKFTEQGEVLVRVHLEPRGENRCMVRVSVRDTGLGIPPERQAELFVPFSQLDTSTARRFGGTGLGLVISRRLCELMGGSISLESDGVSGSTFTFTVEVGFAPAAAATEAVRRPAGTAVLSAPSSLPAAPGPAPVVAPIRALRVLLVEDNPVNALVARRMLARLGYAADEARNGHQAVAACRQHRYDVVLMDLQMPEMDGLAATAAIRALPLATRPWIIAVTAEAMDGDRERCLAGGMDSYLTKPLTVGQLGDQLARVPEPAGAASAVSVAV